MLLLLLRGTLGFIPFSHINHLVVLRGHEVYVVKVKVYVEKDKKYKCI